MGAGIECCCIKVIESAEDADADDDEHAEDEAEEHVTFKVLEAVPAAIF